MWTLSSYASPQCDCQDAFSWPEEVMCRGEPACSADSLLAAGSWHLHTVQFHGAAYSHSGSPWRLHLCQTSINLGATCPLHSPKRPDSSQVNEQTNWLFWVSLNSTGNIMCFTHSGIQKSKAKNNRLTDNTFPNYELCALKDAAY